MNYLTFMICKDALNTVLYEHVQSIIVQVRGCGGVAQSDRLACAEGRMFEINLLIPEIVLSLSSN